MGLPFSIHVRGQEASSGTLERAIGEAFAELRRLDAIFSPYRDDSAISRLGRGACTIGECDPLVAEVLELSALARERTNGAFDITAGGDAGVGRLDPSGIVKSWAAERACAIVIAAARRADVCLNAGGDVRLHCGASTSPVWRVGVEDPDDADRLIAVIERRDGGVATSGPAHRGPHIRDPRTGEPCLVVRSATVAGPSLLWADIYATAAVVHGRAARSFLAGLDGYEGIIVDDTGRTATPGLRRGAT